MNSTLKIVAAASALAILAACSAGGTGPKKSPGSGNGSGGSTSTAAQVPVTSSNQNNVVRAGVNAGLAVSLTTGSMGSVNGSASTTGIGDRTHALTTVLQSTVAAVQSSRKGIASATAHPAATSSVGCTDGGTLTVAVNDHDGSQTLTSGDVITATFAQCKETNTSTINGVITITLTGTPTDTQFLANTTFQSVVVVDNGVTSTLSGGATVSETDASSFTETALTVGSNGLTSSTSSSNYNDNVTFGSGFIIRSEETSAGTVSVSMTGTLTANSLGGSISIATPQALTETADDNYPSSGEIIITGASNSAVRATVLDNTQVKIELDANGDGSYEATANVTWATLM
jgi:hypothetical protein